MIVVDKLQLFILPTLIIVFMTYSFVQTHKYILPNQIASTQKPVVQQHAPYSILPLLSVFIIMRQLTAQKQHNPYTQHSMTSLDARDLYRNQLHL